MAAFQSILTRKETLASGTAAFYFEKPEGFTFIPGQHITLKLTNPTETDDEGNERTFSLITIPSDAEVAVATRMRDTAFKRNLATAEAGLPVELVNPRGSMVIPTTTNRPLVLIAGGIGITPMISMIREAAHQKSAQKLVLFYANRTIEETAFLPELEETANSNPNFSFVPVMTRLQPGENSWSGETGHFSKELFTKYVPDISNTIFYVAGPSGLTQASMQILTEMNVDSLFIKSEDYGEYK